MCANEGCNEAVDFGSTEVVGVGFVCSEECEAAATEAAREEG